MEAWVIVLIVLGGVLILTYFVSLLCFFLTNVRIFHINYERKLDFSLSQYKDKKERMEKEFGWFKSQNFETLYMKNRHGLKLVGKYLKTGDTNKIAIFFHGYRSVPKNDFSAMIPFYQKQGFNILLVHQRSHGESKGKVITFGIKEQKDCHDWVKYVNKKFDNPQILLIGISMGAATVLMASSKEMQNVKAVIADCGYSCPYTIITNTIKILRIPVHPTINFINFHLKFFTGKDLKNHAVTKKLKQSKVPILFIHGLDDKFVPCSMTEENYAATTGEKDILLIEGAGHAGCYVTATKKYETKVKKFLENKF